MIQETMRAIVEIRSLNWVSVAVEKYAPAIVALMAWLTLQPYFVWQFPRTALICSVITAATAACLIVWPARRQWDRLEVIGVGLLGAFVLWITLEKTVDGGHIKWVFVLPTLAACALMNDIQRRSTMGWFATIFAVTLIPGIVYWVLAALGVGVSFDVIPTRNGAMAAASYKLLIANGAVFVESNRLTTEWGGTIFRLCGPFDEPGTVGTIAGLMIAAFGFRLSDWRVATAFVAGLFSFSLAFAVLATVGLLASSVVTRRAALLALFPPIILSAYLSLGWTLPQHNAAQAATRTQSAITVQVNGETKPLAQDATELRQTGAIDNRITPGMRGLIQEYFRANWRTVAFGFASDASVKRDETSQTWMRILTDHGLFGFVLLFGGCAAIAISALRCSVAPYQTAIFFLLFAMSAYQRPVVWMPYALVVLLCGAHLISSRTIPRRSGDGSGVLGARRVGRRSVPIV